MLVHTVFFWLRKDLRGDELTLFRMGLENLTKIEHAQKVFIGTPAETPERPAIVKTYDYCLTVLCKNVAAHDAYQADPKHLDFLEQFGDYWKRVRVYDAD